MDTSWTFLCYRRKTVLIIKNIFPFGIDYLGNNYIIEWTIHMVSYINNLDTHINLRSVDNELCRNKIEIYKQNHELKSQIYLK